MKTIICFLILITTTMPVLSQVEDPVVWKSQKIEHSDFSISPNDSLIAAVDGASNLIFIYDLHTGEILQTVENPGGSLQTVSFSFDGKYLVSAGEDDFFIIWNVTDWSIYRQVSLKKAGTGYGSGVFIITFGNKTYNIAIFDLTMGVLVYDVNTDTFINKILNLDSGNNLVIPLHLAFSSDDHFLAISSVFNPMRVINLENGSTVLQLSVEKSSFAFSPDGIYFAVDFEDYIQLYSAITYQPVNRIDHEHRTKKLYLHFSHNSQYIVMCHPMTILDINTGEIIYKHSVGGTDALFTYNDEYIVLKYGAIYLIKTGLVPTTMDEIINSSLEFFPNPSGNSINIKIDLEVTSDVKLSLHDMTGNEILLLKEGLLEPGEHNYSFDITNIPNGAYFLNLQSSGKTSTSKIIIDR